MRRIIALLLIAGGLIAVTSLIGGGSMSANSSALKIRLIAQTPWVEGLKSPPLMLTGIPSAQGALHRMAPALSRAPDGTAWLTTRTGQTGPIQAGIWQPVDLSKATVDTIIHLVPDTGGVILLGRAGETLTLAAVDPNGALRWRHSLIGQPERLHTDTQGHTWLIGQNADRVTLAQIDSATGNRTPATLPKITNNDILIEWGSAFHVLLKDGVRRLVRTQLADGTQSEVIAPKELYEAFALPQLALSHGGGIFQGDGWHVVGPNGHQTLHIRWAGLVRDGATLVLAQHHGDRLQIQRYQDGSPHKTVGLGPFKGHARLIQANAQGYIVKQQDKLVAFTPNGSPRTVPQGSTVASIEGRLTLSRLAQTPEHGVWIIGTDPDGVYVIEIQGDMF